MNAFHDEPPLYLYADINTVQAIHLLKLANDRLKTNSYEMKLKNLPSNHTFEMVNLFGLSEASKNLFKRCKQLIMNSNYVVYHPEIHSPAKDIYPQLTENTPIIHSYSLLICMSQIFAS